MPNLKKKTKKEHVKKNKVFCFFSVFLDSSEQPKGNRLKPSETRPHNLPVIFLNTHSLNTNINGYYQESYQVSLVFILNFHAHFAFLCTVICNGV